ncbi:MAG TPA: ATP-binding protein, partial [Prosthecobacter sp.]|nr:ATP-binding protein [Prosthecobacter sp.]
PRAAARRRAPHVLLAHHLDDQAETVLANLCRGAGLRGLAGMKAAQPMPGGVLFLRPMLGVSRAEIDARIRARRLPYREDASNQSRDHRRNRLRHEVLPLLDEIFERRTAPLICRAAAQAGLAEAHLDAGARALLADPALLNSDGSLNLARPLLRLHPALLGHTLRLWLCGQLGLDGIGSAEVGAASSMLAPGGPAKVNLPGGRHLRRKARRLWVEA